MADDELDYLDTRKPELAAAMEGTTPANILARRNAARAQRDATGAETESGSDSDSEPDWDADSESEEPEPKRAARPVFAFVALVMVLAWLWATERVVTVGWFIVLFVLAAWI